MNVLEVRALSKRFGTEQAVDRVDFELTEGSATALIGPNGSGKTTTLSMLAGLLESTGGEIQRKKGLSVGFLPQYPRFFPWLTALEFTEMAAKLSGVDPRKARQQAQRTLEFVGLHQVAGKKVGGFSGGMKQRLGLAQAMVHQPSLLLLDEPISSLDPTGRREVMELLKSLLGQTTILYSTHILNDAEEMTDQLLFLRKGRLVEQGSLDQVRSRYADPQIQIRFENTDAAERFVRESPWPATAKGAAAVLPVKAEEPVMQDVFRYLAANGGRVLGVEQETASLEDIFLKVVAEK
ncbi:ABC transporter ATP-binding protein [Planococcus sp. ISL-109]|uniref:ABC transporter ATP-binding protein n=1 Tax=Planococcus sp. ISL-109 TaxID=2819166 RepID=UPI001BE80522|nr:ABC transporter ATP-binding protein [Planococcus sp. ISL-109]MBT2582693.1 ABC transporter ATP-binding protein [Planococcus sp. ISL-109]